MYSRSLYLLEWFCFQHYDLSQRDVTQVLPFIFLAISPTHEPIVSKAYNLTHPQPGKPRRTWGHPTAFWVARCPSYIQWPLTFIKNHLLTWDRFILNFLPLLLCNPSTKKTFPVPKRKLLVTKGLLYYSKPGLSTNWGAACRWCTFYMIGLCVACYSLFHYCFDTFPTNYYWTTVTCQLAAQIQFEVIISLLISAHAIPIPAWVCIQTKPIDATRRVANAKLEVVNPVPLRLAHTHAIYQFCVTQ